MLEGVRVLDFTQVLSGPMATMLLADAGADVVKVERPPAGDITRQWVPPEVQGRSLYFAAFNRGKHSVVADLTDPADRDLVGQLALAADVVVENLRPGSLERFGLGFGDLESRSPGLVYVSIQGYGKGSQRATDPALEVVLEAESGLMAITGVQPVRQGVAFIDMMTGTLAVARLIDALYAKSKTGKGRHVVLSLEETAWLAMTHPYLMHSRAGVPYPVSGTQHPSIAPYEHFDTADLPIIIGAVNDLEFQRLSEILGHPEWAQGRWATNAGRVGDRDALHAAMLVILRQESAARWEARLRQSNLVVGIVRPLSDAAAIWRRDGRAKVVSDDARWGHVEYPGSPWKATGEVQGAPDLGADKDAVVKRWLG